MSNVSFHDDSDDEFDQILMKPKPKVPFELASPPTSEPTTPASPTNPAQHSLGLQAPSSSMDGEPTPSRNRSFLNLTSSTLFGIYQPTGYNTERDDVAATPWGTGAQTPLSRTNSLDMSRVNRRLANGTTAYNSRQKKAPPPRASHKPRRSWKNFYLPLFARVVALFGVGMLYGLLITQLYDRGDIAPTKVAVNRSSWTYLCWWGLGGVVLGEALPWVDTFWASEDEDESTNDNRQASHSRSGKRKGREDWINVVRSIGAFVGVAFAIRKLPWQSTLQLSLTLALANPAIWFIVDRSPPGFVLSACFAIVGTVVLLGMNPALVPSPSPGEVLRAHVLRNGGLKTRIADSLGDEELMLGIFTQESVGVATWIASVLFVSSVCFGNIGRRLAVQEA